MTPALPRKVLLYAVAAVAVIALALWVGTLYGDRRAEANRIAEQTASLQAQLQHIEIGSSFPDFMVRSLNGEGEPYTSELLPDGGGILFLGSESLLLRDVLDTLREALKSKRARSCPTVVLTAGQDYKFLRAEMEKHGIDLPLYLDDSEWLRTGCGVSTETLLYFALDDQQVLTGLGLIGVSSKQFERILKPR